MNGRDDERTDVAIVGGGPVGLTLACELGRRGVACIVLDDKAGTSLHPKANSHNARSMEIYRRLGISAALRAEGLPADRPTDVVYTTRFGGRELGRVPLPSPRAALAEARAGSALWPTPEPPLRMTQIRLEPILLRRAAAEPTVDVRFGWRVEEIAERAGAVTLLARNRDDGRIVRVAATYAVGCDGGRSTVRRAAGLSLAGEGGIDLDFMGGRMVATYFRAPRLMAQMRRAPAWQYWALNPECRAVMVTIDGDTHFLLHYQFSGTGEPDAADFARVLRATAGFETPFEILSSAAWRAGQALVADRFRAGRIFLAGDAAHMFTPTGGFGVNTGIEDAANLGWKLAAALRGWGGPALLDSYESERRPIAFRNTSFALGLARAAGECPVPPEIEDDTPAGAAARAAASAHIALYATNEFVTPGIQLGGRYTASPIVAGDGSAPPPDGATRYVPDAVPGSRAPHVWRADGSALFDHFGAGFTLVRTCPNAPAPHAFAAAADRAGIPLVLLDAFEPAARAAYERDFALIRPDHHLAWRGDRLPGDAAGLLALVTGAAPARNAPVATRQNGGNGHMTKSNGTPNLRFSHFGMSVRDLARSEDFYTRLLGFTVTDRGEALGMSLVFLSRDPAEHHQIVLATGRPDALPANTANRDFGPVINQVSFQMGGLPELKALHARLVAEGVAPLMPADHGIAWSVYFSDPDGNMIECFVDSDWYIKQPFFEPLDLARSDAEIRRATEALCRRSEGFRPYADWRAEIARRMTLYRPQA